MFKCKIVVLWSADPNSHWKRSFECEVASRSFIDAGLRIYARADEVAKEQGRSPQLGRCKRSTIYLQKAGLVYDSIAKIWPESDPVYDLTAIDNT